MKRRALGQRQPESRQPSPVAGSDGRPPHDYAHDPRRAKAARAISVAGALILIFGVLGSLMLAGFTGSRIPLAVAAALALVGAGLVLRSLLRTTGGVADDDDGPEFEDAARRQPCRCCGYPTAVPGAAEPCVVCEWTEELTGAASPGLAAARSNYERHGSIYPPGQRPEWSPAPASAEQRQVGRALLEVYEAIQAGDDRRWPEAFRLERTLRDLERERAEALE